MRSPGNLQGDIVGLLDSAGVLAVEYRYDAWGKPLSVTVHESGDAVAKLAKRNPFRYRGYVYDEETGLYYLRSRYYNPEVGRFLNADTVLAQFKAVLSANAFCYCKDNPVMRVDTHGRRSEWLFALKHPFIASHIGKYIEGKRCTNITTTAVRFAVSLKLRQPKSAKGEGTQVNAVRHALWTGIISRFYGSAIAREAVRSHEKKDMLNLGDSLMGKSVTEISEMAFSSHEEADSMCDILNNEIALQMAWNKETPNEICAAVLEEYHNNGLWLINENSTGFRIYKERLSDSSYNAAVNQLAGLDDYGFTIE